MPRYIIPKGSYDQIQGGKFESTVINFKVIVAYDQKTGSGEEATCEPFAQTSNDVLNDLEALGVYISVGRPLRIDQSASGGSDVDPVLTAYSAGAAQENTVVPFVCEGYSCRENPIAKTWDVEATYRVVAWEDPGHVEARIVSRPRTAPCWRIGETTAIQWDSPPIQAPSTSPYNDVVQLGDIGGIEYDINTQPRNHVVDGLEASFSFVIRGPYYATNSASTLTVPALWTKWTEGDAATTPGRRSSGIEWNESPAATWNRGEWIVDGISVVPINTVDHRVTVTMRYDDFQLCDQMPAQAYAGPIIPKARTVQPALSEPGITTFLVAAKYVMWVNPYPLQRDPFVSQDMPFGVFNFISEALT